MPDVLMLAQQPPDLMKFLPIMILMCVIMYYVTIKPQKRRQQRHEEMLKKLRAKDQVVTSGGIHGSIVKVGEQTVIVKIAENVKIELNKANILANLTQSVSVPEQ